MRALYDHLDSLADAPDAALLRAIGGLSAPSKMPCHGWSIPAQACKLGSLLRQREGSACASCYALKGMYVFPNVRAALERRLGILREALDDVSARAIFRDGFRELLNRKAARTRARLAKGETVAADGRYFRWHDAGDLQSVDHLRLIVEICEGTPEVQHWLPTREAGTVARYLDAYGDDALPRNLTVRLSTPMVGRPVPAGMGRLMRRSPRIVASGIHRPAGRQWGMQACAAPSQGGECRSCRACWDTGTWGVSYRLH